jgi:hypothetical protein
MPFCYDRSCFEHQATFVAHNASFEYLRYVNLPVTSDSCSPSLSYLRGAASSDLVCYLSGPRQWAVRGGGSAIYAPLQRTAVSLPRMGDTSSWSAVRTTFFPDP